MNVILRLRSESARAFRGDASAASRDEVESVMRRVGVTMVPMHPNATDPELASWFVVSDTTPDRAQELAETLRGLAAVEAAYVQPRVAPA